MRVVIAGAGAVGAGLGALLAAGGTEVALIARGAHAARMRAAGLRVRTPRGDWLERLPVALEPAEIRWEPGDICVLAVKTQDAPPLLAALAAAAGPSLPIVCATNGVACERMVAERFDRVHGAMVYVPATHLVPGEVALWSTSAPGILDVGVHPRGTDDVTARLVAALRAAGVDARGDADILGLKLGKLLASTGNAVQALCGDAAGAADLATEARAEAAACYRAAGLDPDALWERLTQRVAAFPGLGIIDGAARPGGSTWQSLARGRGTEAPYLTGEICALGAAHGVPTPLRDALLRTVAAVVDRGDPPGSVDPADIRALAEALAAR